MLPVATHADTGSAVGAAASDPAALLQRASERRAAADLRQADSLVWRAFEATRTPPAHTAAERLAALTIAMRCARPVTTAHADSIAAWTAEVMARPAAAFPGAALEEAWFVAGCAYQNSGRSDSLRAAFARAVAAVANRPGHTPAEQASLLARVAMMDLAGARSRDTQQHARAALDLGSVRCALLSACRSGAARADRFESLQGLERALRLAGIGSVVMSLWPVADADARAWMAAFYRAWLVERE